MEAGAHAVVYQQRRKRVKAASVVVVMRRAARVTVAASARIHATTVSSLRYLSLLCFPLLIKPRLGFCRSISRPIPARPQFPVRFPPALNFSCDSRPPLEFPPALLESPRGTHLWRPPRPPGRPATPFDAQADAIGILARRGGRLPPRARLDA